MRCPWEAYSQSTLEFCERDLCAWVREPANTASNLVYVLLGLWLWRKAVRDRRALLTWLGGVSVVTGLGSAFYHASGLQLAAWADYFGMFLGTAAMTALNVRRWLGWSGARLWGVFGGVAFGLLGGVILFPSIDRSLYVWAMPCCAIELRLFFRDGASIRYRNYLWANLAIAIGVVFWWLDLSRTLCDPENHWVTGHSLWHAATAVSFYFFYRFYAQFPFGDRKAT